MEHLDVVPVLDDLHLVVHKSFHVSKKILGVDVLQLSCCRPVNSPPYVQTRHSHEADPYNVSKPYMRFFSEVPPRSEILSKIKARSRLSLRASNRRAINEGSTVWKSIVLAPEWPRMNASTCNRAWVLTLFKEGEDERRAPRRKANELSLKLRNNACKTDVENWLGTVRAEAEAKA